MSNSETYRSPWGRRAMLRSVPGTIAGLVLLACGEQQTPVPTTIPAPTTKPTLDSNEPPISTIRPTDPPTEISIKPTDSPIEPTNPPTIIPAEPTLTTSPESRTFILNLSRNRAVDTMTLSRDHAQTVYKPMLESGDQNTREYIRTIMKSIKSVGATEVAIGTSWDDEYFVVFEAFSQIAIEEGLSPIWRGAPKDFEGWYDTKKNNDPENLTSQTEAFIRTHADFFRSISQQAQEKGLPAPIFQLAEPENAWQGGDYDASNVKAFNGALKEWHIRTSSAFTDIQAPILTTITTNGYVAEHLITEELLEETKINGQRVVFVDHHSDLGNFGTTLDRIAEKWNAYVFLAEFGGPKEQTAEFLGGLFDQIELRRLESDGAVVGANLWPVTYVFSEEIDPQTGLLKAIEPTASIVTERFRRLRENH